MYFRAESIGDGTEACSEMDLGEKAMLPLPCLWYLLFWLSPGMPC